MRETDTDFRASRLIEICRELHRQGFLAAADGNLSYRADSRIFITPAGVAKAGLEPGEMAEIHLNGTVAAGRPSSERHLHLSVYRHCPEAGAVIHAHPPCAIALSIARPDWERLPEGALSELVLAVGRVPVVPYARPGTGELAESIVPFLPGHRAMILARHGVLCWGETLEEAAHGVERLEHAARVLCLALQMGGISELEEAEVRALQAMREKLGRRIR